MSGSGSGPLQPTWHGFIQNSMDGLMLFEACLSGKLHHVPRRPHDRERASLIKSGSVFIYEENASGIKRWTDGVAWSPSRILGNFLIYRELEKPFPPGEKKRAMKRKRSSQEPEGRRDSEDNESEYNRLPPTPPSPAIPTDSKSAVPGAQDTDKEMERQLIGSLVDSYGFRPHGLVKKTMSISLNGVSHHLVSYYTVDDVKQRKLQRPLNDSRLTGLTVRPELFMKQNFRAPVEETEHYAVDSVGHAYPHMVYSPMVAAGGYALRAGTYGPGYPMYTAAVTTAPLYNSLPATATSSGATWSHPYSTAQTQPGYEYYGRNTSSTPQTSSASYPPMQSAHYQSPLRTSAQSYGQPQSSSITTSSTPVSANSSQYPPSSYPATSSTPVSANSSQYPPSSYPVQQNTQQSVSPHQQSLRSPPVGGQSHSLHNYPPRSNLPSVVGNYRHFPSPNGGPTNEMPSIGMQSGYGSNQAQTSTGHYGSASYAPNMNAPQTFRHSNETGTGVPAAGQY